MLCQSLSSILILLNIVFFLTLSLSLIPSVLINLLSCLECEMITLYIERDSYVYASTYVPFCRFHIQRLWGNFMIPSKLNLAFFFIDELYIDRLPENESSFQSEKFIRIKLSGKPQVQDQVSTVCVVRYPIQGVQIYVGSEKLRDVYRLSGCETAPFQLAISGGFPSTAGFNRSNWEQHLSALDVWFFPQRDRNTCPQNPPYMQHQIHWI